jgi:hypothetical protein
VTSGWVFLVTLASTIGGSVLGAVLRHCLPARHLGADNKEVIRLGVGLLATLSAVAISLMIASAKSSYDIQDAHFRQFSADVILTDQLLAQYGPEAAGIRLLIRQAVPAALDRVWAEKAIGAPQAHPFTASSAAEQIYDRIEALSPASDAQRLLKPRIEQASGDIARARLLMFADVDTPIQPPFLAVLILWLTVIFTSFSLFVEPGPVIAVALLVFALSIASALFLVADLSRPFTGLMQVSNQHLRDALGPLN